VTRFRSRVSSNSNASPPGNRKQGRSLASNVEHSFFIKHLCWAARRMGRDRASVPRSMAPNEEPVCGPSDALDAQSNYLASLRGRKIASALGTSLGAYNNQNNQTNYDSCFEPGQQGRIYCSFRLYWPFKLCRSGHGETSLPRRFVICFLKFGNWLI
jgi:hypothetical protein